MEHIKEKKLLYYDHYQIMPKHYNGNSIIHFNFIDVKTGKNFVLGQSYAASEMSNILDGYYYEDITKATDDFDILWSLSDTKISPITATFEKVQAEYQKILNEGITKEEVNFKMLTLFQEKNQKTISKKKIKES